MNEGATSFVFSLCNWKMKTFKDEEELVWLWLSLQREQKSPAYCSGNICQIALATPTLYHSMNLELN